MALITGTMEGYGWGDFNKVTDEALSIRYMIVNGTTVTYGDGTFISWRARRFATKRYSYVGMDYATALRCRDAKIAQYTRTKRLYSWNGNGWTSSIFEESLQADVRASRVAGRMWKVEIQVNESDEAVNEQALTYTPTPQMLFDAMGISDDPENYDE